MNPGIRCLRLIPNHWHWLLPLLFAALYRSRHHDRLRGVGPACPRFAETTEAFHQPEAESAEQKLTHSLLLLLRV